MPFDANVPVFVDPQTQSSAKQTRFCQPNNGPSNFIDNSPQANVSNANFNPAPQLTNVDFQRIDIQLTNRHSIKLPPLKLQNFKGDPLHFHEWFNNL